MIYLIGKKFDSKNNGLYIDDRQFLPEKKGMQIIIQCNLNVINYLDVTFNLNDDSYRPYPKPNDNTWRIHVQSYHPPCITKQLPWSIEKCLSQSSSSKDIFDKTTPYYEQRLASFGYNEKLTYQQQVENIENNKTIGKLENGILYGLT